MRAGLLTFMVQLGCSKRARLLSRAGTTHALQTDRCSYQGMLPQSHPQSHPSGTRAQTQVHIDLEWLSSSPLPLGWRSAPRCRVNERARDGFLTTARVVQVVVTCERGAAETGRGLARQWRWQRVTRAHRHAAPQIASRRAVLRCSRCRQPGRSSRSVVMTSLSAAPASRRRTRRPELS